MSNKLIMLRGLPGSGKSVHSLKYVQQGYKRINADDLRLMIDNGNYSKSNEKYVTDVMQTMAALALQEGLNVIMDNTHFNPFWVKWAKALTRDTRSELQIIDINTPLDICIARDLERTKGRVGRDVIMRMYTRWFGPNGEFPKVEE